MDFYTASWPTIASPSGTERIPLDTNYPDLVTKQAAITLEDLRIWAVQVLNVMRYGAVVDGVANDRSAFTAMRNAVGYMVPAPGTSLIAEGTIGISLDSQSIFGQPRITKLLADNTVGNGIGLLRIGTQATLVNKFYASGLDITLPAGTSNQLRAIQLRSADDAWLERLILDASRAGSYAIQQTDANYNRLVITAFDILSEATGILIKPNQTSPTSNTFQGQDLLITSGRLRGQGTPSGAAIACDGNWINVVIAGILVAGRDGGFGCGIANDGADRSKARGYVLGISGIRGTGTAESIHIEDNVRGAQYVGLSLLDGKRGVECIANSQGSLQLGNFLGLFADGHTDEGVRFVSDSVNTGPEGVNVAFSLIRDWGKTTPAPGLTLGGAYGNKINVIGAMLLDGAGDGIKVSMNGVDVGASRAGGINIDYTHIEGNTGASLDVTSAAANKKVRIGSGNTFRSTGGLLSATMDFTNVIGDKDWTSEAFTAGASEQIKIQFAPERAGAIAKITLVYETTNNSTVANVVELHKFTAPATDTTMLSFTAPTGTDAAFTKRSMVASFASNSARKFAAGDVIYLRKTNAGDGSYRFRVVINYFEYFD